MPAHITDAEIQAILDSASRQSSRLGSKSTIMCVILPNGYEIIESATCADPADYNHTAGVAACLEKVKTTIRELEEYRLQYDA